MWENIEILNLYQQKLFGVRTKFSYYKVFRREFVSNINEKKKKIKTKKDRDNYQ